MWTTCKEKLQVTSKANQKENFCVCHTRKALEAGLTKALGVYIPLQCALMLDTEF
jgi:hypothetical protein